MLDQDWEENGFRVWQLEGPRPGPHLLLSAGVHGDEYEPMLAISQLAQQLGPELLAGKVTLVPLANPTAYACNQRCGTDGKDLARSCPGDAAGSHTDRAASRIAALIRQADYYIDLHTGGLVYDILPFAGYVLHPDGQVLQRQQQMARAFNLPAVWGTDPHLQGRTLSVARDAGIPAIYVEYGGGASARSEVLAAYVQGCRQVMASLGMLAPKQETAPAPAYWVEDHTRDRGNLQTKMPAPVPGLFLAAVRLGQVVEKGAPWGSITDPQTGTCTPVPAEHDGLVFLLRAAAKVAAGDSLGGLLPIVQPGKVVIHEQA